MNLNSELFKLINGLAYRSTVLDQIMIIFSTYVPVIFMLSAAILYLYGVWRKDEKARFISVSTIVFTVVNLIISYFIGLVYYIPRPFVHGKVNLLMPHPADASFPSDHSVGTMSIALGIFQYSRMYGIIMFILSFGVGISRVYVGHHYPSDVLGGYVLVFAVNFIFKFLLQDKVIFVYKKVESILLRWLPVKVG